MLGIAEVAPGTVAALSEVEKKNRLQTVVENHMNHKQTQYTRVKHTALAVVCPDKKLSSTHTHTHTQI